MAGQPIVFNSFSMAFHCSPLFVPSTLNKLLNFSQKETGRSRIFSKRHRPAAGEWKNCPVNPKIPDSDQKIEQKQLTICNPETANNAFCKVSPCRYPVCSHSLARSLYPVDHPIMGIVWDFRLAMPNDFRTFSWKIF